MQVVGRSVWDFSASSEHLDARLFRILGLLAISNGYIFARDGDYVFRSGDEGKTEMDRAKEKGVQAGNLPHGKLFAPTEQCVK